MIYVLQKCTWKGGGKKDYRDFEPSQYSQHISMSSLQDSKVWRAQRGTKGGVSFSLVGPAPALPLDTLTAWA